MVSAERSAAVLSLAAAAIHASMAPAHFTEWWGYGLFFMVAAAAQIIFGLLLVTHGLQIKDRGWPSIRGQVYVAGIVGNAAIIALWAVTRTTGIPWFGPHAGEVEEVGFIDVVSKILELALIVVLAVLVRRASVEEHSAGSPMAAK